MGDRFLKMPDSIMLPTQEGIHIVQTVDIIRCETFGSYTTFHLINEKKIILSKSLSSFKDVLFAPFFLRVHHSHLVNFSKIVLYQRKGFLNMADGAVVPVSRSKKVIIRHLLESKPEV